MENKRRDSRLVLHVVDVKNPTNWDIAEIAFKWEKKTVHAWKPSYVYENEQAEAIELRFLYYLVKLGVSSINRKANRATGAAERAHPRSR